MLQSAYAVIHLNYLQAMKTSILHHEILSHYLFVKLQNAYGIVSMRLILYGLDLDVTICMQLPIFVWPVLLAFDLFNKAP